eukprot:48669-Karenia_brevis.AAC.1
MLGRGLSNKLRAIASFTHEIFEIIIELRKAFDQIRCASMTQPENPLSRTPLLQFKIDSCQEQDQPQVDQLHH